MKALDLKLLRDLLRLKSQVVSIAAIVACGSASVIAMRSTLDSIERARDDYYDRARFPQVFASLKRAPQSKLRTTAGSEGIDARAADRRRPRLRTKVASDDVGERALAGAVGADESMNVAAFDGEIHVAQDRWSEPIAEHYAPAFDNYIFAGMRLLPIDDSSAA